MGLNTFIGKDCKGWKALFTLFVNKGPVDEERGSEWTSEGTAVTRLWPGQKRGQGKHFPFPSVSQGNANPSARLSESRQNKSNTDRYQTLMPIKLMLDKYCQRCTAQRSVFPFTNFTNLSVVIFPKELMVQLTLLNAVFTVH